MSEATLQATGNGAAPGVEETSDVAGRLAALRKLSTTDADAARDQAWAWFKELGAEAASSSEASDELNEIFRAGNPPPSIEGQTQGILVSFVWKRPINVALKTITGAWMPWAGKRFNSADSRGDNVLAGSARWPAKLLWPLYNTGAAQGGRSAFDFETQLEPGKNDPDVTVLKIDYHDVESNPRLLIRSIRDELVEVVPGAYLGKMLWRHDSERHTLLAYFALRQPPEGE
jgi:hypothetical protein